MNSLERKSHIPSKWSLAVLIIFYAAAGFNHFRDPAFYVPLIPDYLGNKVLLNSLSGVAEIGLAIGMIFTITRRWAAWGILLMLLAFLPAHILMIQKNGCIDPDGLCVAVWIMWVRLLVIHPLLIAWVWPFTKRNTG